MAGGLSATEQFLVLFNNLKQAAGNKPESIPWLYKESKTTRNALDALNLFLARADFERRIFQGKKIVVPRADGFEAAWKEYAEKWRFRVNRPAIAIPIRLDDSDPDPDPDGSILAALMEQSWKESQIEPDPVRPELAPPDPKTEDLFDPLRHDGAAAIEMGIEYLEAEVSQRLDLEGPDLLADEPEWANRRSIALGAHDYLVNTVGLDVHGVFRRWQQVPVILMPAHVSNRYGASDKGSLLQLVDDAVRAYVFGARAAAMAMCRAVHDMLRNEHHGPGELENVIAHASAEWDFINMEQIDKYRYRANWVMHNYKNDDRLNDQDDRIILNYLIALKYLVEHAPTR